ncbi:MAG: polysaccharide deacetylase family protein, partial [Thermodesulfobacteriota bacterium]
MAVLLAAAGLWLIHPLLSAAALAAFVVACLAAPFFPQTGFFFPVAAKGRKNISKTRAAVALTFDDGPDPQTTPALLELLAGYQAPAAFFVTGQKAEKHPGLIRSILDNGHLIGNHTYHHDTTIMLKSRKTLEQEIAAAQAVLERFGITALAFRPPAGVVNPKL